MLFLLRFAFLGFIINLHTKFWCFLLQLHPTYTLCGEKKYISIPMQKEYYWHRSVIFRVNFETWCFVTQVPYENKLNRVIMLTECICLCINGFFCEEFVFPHVNYFEWEQCLCICCCYGRIFDFFAIQLDRITYLLISHRPASLGKILLTKNGNEEKKYYLLLHFPCGEFVSHASCCCFLCQNITRCSSLS